MDTAHLEKLRRFSLTIAIALISVVAAGLTVSPKSDVTVLGIPFAVSRPSLLPLGLAIASLCSAVQFFYYGHMLGVSPHRKRRTTLNALTVNPDTDPKPSLAEKLFVGKGYIQLYGTLGSCRRTHLLTMRQP
jgi:hypothetical protein